MYSLFNNRDYQVFSEIFCFNVPGGSGPVSVQRRFWVTDKWGGDMSAMPFAADRRHFGTPFVPSDSAVLLLQMGVLEIPEGSSWVVEYGGSGHYFPSSTEALRYCTNRWPAAMALFRQKVERGEPLEISESRKAAFDERWEQIQPWQDKADALSAQIQAQAQARSDDGSSTPAEG